MTTLQDRQKHCHLFLLASLQGNADSHAVCRAEGWLLGPATACVSLLARCAIQGGGGRGAGGGGARGSSRRGSSRAPGAAAWGAGWGADGSGGLGPGDTPRLLAGLLLLGLEGLTADMVVLLPVLVLAEGATVARCVAAATCLTGLATTVPAALTDTHEEHGKSNSGLLLHSWTIYSFATGKRLAASYS